jgi:hypothetical protein
MLFAIRDQGLVKAALLKRMGVPPPSAEPGAQGRRFAEYKRWAKAAGKVPMSRGTFIRAGEGGSALDAQAGPANRAPANLAWLQARSLGAAPCAPRAARAVGVHGGRSTPCGAVCATPPTLPLTTDTLGRAVEDTEAALHSFVAAPLRALLAGGAPEASVVAPMCAAWAAEVHPELGKTLWPCLVAYDTLPVRRASSGTRRPGGVADAGRKPGSSLRGSGRRGRACSRAPPRLGPC